MKKTLLVMSFVALFGCEISKKSSSNSDSSTNDSFNDNSVQIDTVPEDVKVCQLDEDENVSDCENPICDEIMTLDGPGDDGFLWKPEDEDEGPAVVLLPSAFVRPFQEVRITRLDGTVEEAVFTGFTNPDRQTWRFLLVGENYLPRITADEFRQQCVWIFPDASVRQD